MRCLWALPVLLLSACSDLTSGSHGVVALEIRIPSPAFVEPNDTLVLHARALDLAGDSVDVPTFWFALDSTVVVVDSTEGLVTTSRTDSTGRVQARAGSIRSDPALLTIRGPSDTLVITGSDTFRVASGDTASATLDAAVQSFIPPAQGVPNTAIVYQVLDSASVVGKVHLPGGGLVIRALTGLTGEPLQPVTVNRGTVTPAPDSVVVSIQAYRPSGKTVPGSGQQFVVRFDP